MPRSILVTGATGKQGGAVVQALLSSPRRNDFTIHALTRSVDSPSARKLAEKAKNIKLVQGDLDHVESIFKSAKEPYWGVFSMQTPYTKGGSADKEETQGKALVDAALAHGTKHFVYSSVDRGGDKSIDNPTSIPHFISKHNIEKHLIAQTKKSGQMSWTILRPVAFMDNFTDDFMGRVMPAAWKNNFRDQPLQLVATKDIGKFGALAFLEPEAYKNRGISLAGDELNFEQMSRVFRERTGRNPPETFGLLVSAMMKLSKEFGAMVNWFRTEGYGANVAECKKQLPEMTDLGTWLETESAWKKS